MKKYFYLLVTLVIVSQGMAQSVQTLLPVKGNLEFTRNSDESVAIINFSSVVPKQSKIDSCILQLTVLESPISKGNLYITKFGDKKSLSRIQIQKAMKKDTVLTFYLDNNVLKGENEFKLEIHAKPVSFNSSSPLAGDSDIKLGRRPRLIVKYTSSQTSRADWAGARADSRNSNRSIANVTGARVSSLEIVSVLPSDVSVLTNPVSYDGSVYVLADQAGITVLYQINGKKSKIILKDLIKPRTDKTFTPVVDDAGRFYYADGNNINVIDLYTLQIITPAYLKDIGSRLSADLTLGRDGSIYAVTEGAVKAFSPSPAFYPMWVLSNATIKFGKPAINSTNTTLYVVSSNDTLHAINTIDGKEMNKIKINISKQALDEIPPFPVIDDKGNLFVTDKINSSDSIRIYTPYLKIKDKALPGKINSPLAIAPFNMDGVFYTMGENLNLLRNQEIVKKGSETIAQSLVSDINGNVYILKADQLQLYLKKDSLLTESPLFSKGSIERLVGTVDGNVYFVKDKKLLLGRPMKFETDYTLSSEDTTKIRSSIRGQNLIVPKSIELSKEMILWGRNDVKIERDVTLKNTAVITLRSGGSITFGAGFKVDKGAQLKCITGF